MERLVKAARGVKAGNVLPQWRAGRWHGARLNARRLARLHSHCHAHGLTVESAVQRLGLPPPTHAHRHQSSAEAIRPLVGAKVMGRVGAMGRVLPPVHERSEARASDRVASTYGGENNEGGGEVVWPYGSIVREDGGVNLRAVPYTVFRELAHVLDDDLLIGGSGSSKSASNSASNSNTTTTTTTPSTTTTTNSQLSTLNRHGRRRRARRLPQVRRRVGARAGRARAPAHGGDAGDGGGGEGGEAAGEGGKEGKDRPPSLLMNKRREGERILQLCGHCRIQCCLVCRRVGYNALYSTTCPSLS